MATLSFGISQFSLMTKADIFAIELDLNLSKAGLKKLASLANRNLGNVANNPALLKINPALLKFQEWSEPFF